jgi:hypothetical protein
MRRMSPDSPAEILETLGVAAASRADQMEAIAVAAYGGGLFLAELRVLREAGLLPYDASRDSAAGS